jgi:YD repeat-containing protein
MNEVVDLIDALEGEVNNGGFHQYFYNSAGDRTAETIQALEIVGAFAMADIVNRAAQRFPHGMPPKNRFERQDVLLEAYPNAGAFQALDDEFYKYPDNLAALVTKYKSSV